MNQSGLKFSKYFVCFLSIAFIFHSCGKIMDSPIPEVYVNFQIDLRITNELTIPGNSVKFPGVGYGGVIVTCFTPGEWYAFDAACTYEVSPNCSVTSEGGVAKCPCCESEYVLFGGGFPSKEPASMPLKQYHVSTVNPSVIRIYN